MPKQMNSIFIKLGGSLITYKDKPKTANLETIKRLAQEIHTFLKQDKEHKILLGHGSGSFGHVSAKSYKTRDGVFTQEGWLGFSKVWHDASTLNKIVSNIFHEQGIPTITFPPSASIITHNHRILEWDIKPILAALESRLVPVVYGDVVFDLKIGGTILSTEELFVHLANLLKPSRVLIVGNEPGVYADYPVSKDLIPVITPNSLDRVLPNLHGSSSVDVTGGMLSKVHQMVHLVEKNPSTSVSIFSGNKAGLLLKALQGDFPGTTIQASNY